MTDLKINMRRPQELNNFIHISPALLVSYEDILVSLFCMYQVILSLHNAVWMSMAICISTMSCYVLRSLPFSKTCKKVFEMSLWKGLNIHSMFDNARYKFYCPKRCRLYLMQTIQGLFWENLIYISRHNCLQCCEYLLSPVLTWLLSGFHFLGYSDRELKLLLNSQ